MTSHSRFSGSGPWPSSQSRKSLSHLYQLHRAYLSGRTLSSRCQAVELSPQAGRALYLVADALGSVDILGLGAPRDIRSGRLLLGEA